MSVKFEVEVKSGAAIQRVLYGFGMDVYPVEAYDAWLQWIERQNDEDVEITTDFASFLQSLQRITFNNEDAYLNLCREVGSRLVHTSVDEKVGLYSVYFVSKY